MRHSACFQFFFFFVAFFSLASVDAQDAKHADHKSLMDSMTGDWVMTGTIEGEKVTHDVSAEWILNRQYIRIHELSRETTAEGSPEYEAWIHIAWDDKNSEFVVMWLDTTGTTNFASEGVGHGKPTGKHIPFVWKFEDGSGIQTTFSYESDGDTWSWAIDGVDKSQNHSEFARLKLTRKPAKSEHDGITTR